MKTKLSLFAIPLLVLSLFLIIGMTIPVQAQEGDTEEVGILVPIDRAQTPNNPDVAWNNTCQKFLVVYDRTRVVADTNIWGRYVDDTGAVALPVPFQITTGTANSRQKNPAVAYNAGGGNYLVVWEDYRGGLPEIYAQLWNCAMMSAGPLVNVTNNPWSQIKPDVACGQSSGCWVVWEDIRPPAGGGVANWEIWGQRFNAAGIKVGDNVNITAQASAQHNPTIASNPDITVCSDRGSFMVAWEDSRNVATTGIDIYIRQLNRVGGVAAFCGGSLPVLAASYRKGNQVNPDLAYGTTNHAYQVVWRDYFNDVNGYIRACRVTGAGAGLAPFGGLRLSDPPGPPTQSKPAVSYGTILNHFNTVWYDNRNAGIGHFDDIYGQRSTGMGVVMIPPGNLPIANTADWDETNPAIAYSQASNIYFVVWDNSVNGIEGAPVDP